MKDFLHGPSTQRKRTVLARVIVVLSSLPGDLVLDYDSLVSHTVQTQKRKGVPNPDSFQPKYEARQGWQREGSGRKRGQQGLARSVVSTSQQCTVLGQLLLLQLPGHFSENLII